MKKDIRVYDLNQFINRFISFDIVFHEYLDTMKMITMRKALVDENYSDLKVGYVHNVKRFSQEAYEFIEREKYRGNYDQVAGLEKDINNYIINLIHVLGFINFRQNILSLKIHRDVKKMQDKLRTEINNDIVQISQESL